MLNFNRSGELCVNLELFESLSQTSSFGTPMDSPPWVLKDIGKAYSTTYKYTASNRIWLGIYDIYNVNTSYLNLMDVGSFISAPQTSNLNIVVHSRISNPIINDDMLYFACEDGFIYKHVIGKYPPTVISSDNYYVEDFAIDHSICFGYSKDHIVYVESPDFSPSSDYNLKYYDILSNKSYVIEGYGNTYSFSAEYSKFRKDRLVSFKHPTIGFVICYVYSTVLNVYDASYTKIYTFDIAANGPWTSGSPGGYIKVSPDRSSVFVFKFSAGEVFRFTMGSGTYSYSYLSVTEMFDIDFGYTYGSSPSNVYILEANGSYSVWDTNKDKFNIGTSQYIYSYNYSSGYSPSYILTDKRDPSETCYLFFGNGYAGPSYSTMTNIYFAVTYSLESSAGATYTAVNGPLVKYSPVNTSSLNCMIMIDGSNVNPYSPSGHILQYYSSDNKLLIFNTSRGKVSEVVSETTVELSSGSSEYDLVKFNEDDVYLLIDRANGEYQIIYW